MAASRSASRCPASRHPAASAGLRAETLHAMRRKRIVATLVSMLVMGAGASDVHAAGRKSARHAVRATATKYLHALGRGDGKAACALLSAEGLADYGSKAACRQQLSHARFLGKYKVVAVHMLSRRSGLAEINDADISDSGNDSVQVTRYGSRWLLDSS